MIAAFLAALPIAIGTVLANLPVVSVPLILATRSDRRAHFGFLSGWVAGFLVLGGAVILLSDLSAAGEGAPAAGMVWLRLALGAGLVVLGVLKFRVRTRAGEEAEPPGWMRLLDRMGAVRTFAFGLLFVALNPKNAVLVASGALTVAAATYAPAAQVAAYLGFTAVASLGVAAPLVLTLALGERAAAPLARLKAVMARHSGAIVGVVLAILGAVVMANAAGDLGATLPRPPG
jgi:hypothetical protein